MRTEKEEITSVPVVGEDFAGAERVLEEGVRVEETFPFRTPVLLFPEPDFWEPSITWELQKKCDLD